jgi:hypothetical protein
MTSSVCRPAERHGSAPIDLVHRLRVAIDAFSAVRLLAADEREAFERLLAGNVVQPVIVRAIAADLAALAPLDAELYFDAEAIRLDAAGLADDTAIAHGRALVALAFDAAIITETQREALAAPLVPGVRASTLQAMALDLTSAAPSGSGVDYSARALLDAFPRCVR